MEYGGFVVRSKKYYGAMRVFQKIVGKYLEWLVKTIFRVICNDRFSKFFLLKYLSF